MTDLLHTIPDFPTKQYTHLLPSLEKNLITTTDLLTLDALEVAKRAQLPLLDVRRLASHVLAILQGQLGLKPIQGLEHDPRFENVGEGSAGFGALRKSGQKVLGGERNVISTLDENVDKALGGGIPTGYITEITGESGVGKTQLLLTVLLSSQLPYPSGLGRPSIYISTEHPLPTTRLAQMLTHPPFSTSQNKPTLSNILSIQTPDLESQEHILTYQLPVALARHKAGLVVIDSIAANYRAEHAGNSSNAKALATRSAQLVKLGALLRSLAREHDCAIVVANQVSDRFAPINIQPPSTARPPTSSAATQNHVFSSSPASTATPMHPPVRYANEMLSLDHQQRFFTGWGADSPSLSQQQDSQGSKNLKTPALGLAWANQIACRVVLVKTPSFAAGEAGYRDVGEEAAEWAPRRWRRWMRVVFAPWVEGTGGKGVEFEIWGGGVRTVGTRSYGLGVEEPKEGKEVVGETS